MNTTKLTREQAQRSALAQLEFIIENIPALRLATNSDKPVAAARNMRANAKDGVDLTPSQLAYIDDLYEKTMRGLGLESCERTSHRRGK
jgi:hypothetical protein